MKLYSLVKQTMLFGIVLGATLTISKKSYAESTNFFCGTYEGILATIADTSLGEFPIIFWQSEHFIKIGYTPMKRCLDTSSKFQIHYTNGTLNYIYATKLNDKSVVCVARNKGDSCLEALFDLRPGSNLGMILQRILNIDDSDLHIINDVEGKSYIDMNEYLNRTINEPWNPVPLHIINQGEVIELLSYTGNTGYEVFTNTATGNSTATFMFELSEIKEEANAFGIYNVNNPMETVNLFDGANFYGNNGDFLTVTPPSFHLFDYDWNRFGFYLERGDGTTFYTQSILNPDGLEQAVVYRGDDETDLQMPGRPPGTFTESEFIIAFEDMALASGSDADYNDLVVIVGLIEPIGVPEPRAIAGLVLIVISLASSVIAKKIKKTIINYDLDF